jgi:acetyl/propionyl-CoA carboxylase alpha subunit
MARPFSKVLVANRGEIARRVFAGCRALGLATVAIHSDADAGAPFVAEAESAFGDGTVFVEPYVEAGRHVEVQVVADADTAVALGTRDLLGLALDVVARTPLPEPRFGVFRM